MSEYKLKGYVAKDRGKNNPPIFFYDKKPIRYENLGIWGHFGERHAINMPYDWFPELKYTDEPIEVELTIKKL